MDLGGTWRAAVADEGVRREAPDPGFDDGAWSSVEVPGHWRSTPELADADGPVVHRRTFEADPPAGDDRWWLTVEGVIAQGDVWLDGAYLGDTEGYFVPHAFEVGHLLAARREHVVVVEATCPRDVDGGRRPLTGALQAGPAADPTWNPGGIWRPVGLEHTGPVRIRRLRVRCVHADAERAVIALRAELDAATSGPAVVSTSVSGPLSRLDVAPTVSLASEDRVLAAGRNLVEWTIAVERPERWWPWSLGAQPRYEVSVTVAVGGRVSHSRERRIGLRSVSMSDFVLSVNGVRIFAKGASHGPTRSALGSATPDEVRRDVELARAGGLDLLRVHAHVARPELYDAADDHGVLLWQDLPLIGRYPLSTGRPATQLARRAVDLLGHHPSVVVWCGHDEPTARLRPPSRRPRIAGGLRAAAWSAMRQQLPSYSRSLLDRKVRRALVQTDASRPVVGASGLLPHLPRLDGTDTHAWFGWRTPRAESLASLMRLVPRLGRFLGAFGARSVPTTGGPWEPTSWPEVDRAAVEAYGWDRLLEQRVPLEGHATFADWTTATQAHQAEVVRRQIEALRRLKYRPTGGFTVFALADSHPTIGFGLLDHDRVPKLAHRAVVEACRPAVVVADPLPGRVAPGDALALDVHVVNDLRRALTGATVTAELVWRGGRHRWRWKGDVAPDACARVATIQAIVPPAVGTIELQLHLAAGVVRATNRYRAAIVAPRVR